MNQDERDDLTQEDTAGLVKGTWTFYLKPVQVIDHRLSHDRLLEGEFIPGAGDEFSEIGGPAAIRNLDTDPILRIQGSIYAMLLNIT